MCTTLANCSKLSSDLQLATSSASVEYASGRSPSTQVRLQTMKQTLFFCSFYRTTCKMNRLQNESVCWNIPRAQQHLLIQKNIHLVVQAASATTINWQT